MRKHTIRTGMRLVLAALMLIILVSFYHGGLADLFGLSFVGEERFYNYGIFWAAAIGGYGAVLIAFGFVLYGNARDSGVRLLPIFMLILVSIFLYIFLIASSFNVPSKPERLRPGNTITI